MAKPRKQSLHRRMRLHMLVFGVLPVCALLIVYLVTSIGGFLSEARLDLAARLSSCGQDIQLLQSQIENVILTFVTSDQMAHLLQSRTQAEWTTGYLGEAYDEATRAEGYLSSLGAKVVIIYDDRERGYSEQWATLLRMDRYREQPYFADFEQSPLDSAWCGLVPALPGHVSDSFEFRGYGKRLVYLTKAHVISQRVGCIVECAVPAEPFVDAVRKRMEGIPCILWSDSEVVYTSDPNQFSAADAPDIQHGNSFSVAENLEIEGMHLTLAAMVPVKPLVYAYIAQHGAALLLLPLSIILLFLTSYHVLSNLLNRLENLASAADSIRGDETFSLPEGGEDEVGRVVRAINQLLDRIKQQGQEQVQQEKDKRKLQALALQYQLNPHFLFNSLQWVQMEMERQGLPAESSDSVATLGYVLRYNLTESLKATLEEESEHLQAYTAFMSEMKQETITLEVESDLVLSEIEVPRFMLQPIVENALQHGLRKGQPLHILVRTGRSAPGRLGISVSNDGTPIDAENLARIRTVFQHPQRSQNAGYGLSNLVQRLNLTYGEHYEANVTSTERETIFELIIPLMAPSPETDRSA